MTLAHWTLFMATQLVVCLVQGPAVLFVVAQALRVGGRRASWAIAGILAASAFYFALSALGLGALVAASHTVFLGVKWVGAAYLVVQGVQLWRTAGAGVLGSPSHDSETSVDGGVVAAAADLTMFRRAFITETANPKALVYFTALLPQFIDLHRPITPQVLVLGASAVVAEFFVLAGYSLLAGRVTHLAAEPRFSRVADRVAGTLLIGAGAGLALASEG